MNDRIEIIDLDSPYTDSEALDNTSAVEVGKGKRVSLHFSLSLSEGSLSEGVVIDSNFDKSPATFSVGDGNLLPGFEQALFGMQAGERKKVLLSAEQAFGPVNLKNIHEFPKHKFSQETELKVGGMISFADAGNNELPGTVAELKQDTVLIDFNHPLAGREIIFEAEILSVESIEKE